MCKKLRIYPSGATKRKNKAEITKTVKISLQAKHMCVCKVALILYWEGGPKNNIAQGPPLFPDEYSYC